MKKINPTKKAIGEGMAALCQTVPFKKMSVQQIAQSAGINRQSFYYHFSDKFALLRWFYHEDSLRYLESGTISLDNWEEEALKMLKAIKEKADFYLNTVSSNPEILMNEFSVMTQKLFISLFENMDIDKQLSEEDKVFYARFFSYGCSGVLTQWILEGFRETPLEIAAQLFRLAKDTELFSYRIFAQEQSEDEWRIQ